MIGGYEIPVNTLVGRSVTLSWFLGNHVCPLIEMDVRLQNSELFLLCECFASVEDGFWIGPKCRKT